MPKLSIIIPVYNAEKFLSRCIDSVLSQTYSDFELILVNDGSKDTSDQICDAYAQKDRRIRVIHQENGGVSRARNRGLDVAQGAYIGFVDADDYIAPNTLEIAMEALGDGDMCMFDAITVWDNGKTEVDTISLLPENCILTKKDWYPELLLEMAGAVWRCIYKAELLKGLRFPAGIKFSEDRIFNLYAMGRAETLSYRKLGLYYRVMQDESAVHRYHEDYFDACLKAHRGTQAALSQVWQEERYSIAYQSQLIWGAVSAASNYCYKTSPLSFRQRLEKIRQMCNQNELQQAMRKNAAGGIRAKLMRRKLVFGVWLLAEAANLKNGQ